MPMSNSVESAFAPSIEFMERWILATRNQAKSITAQLMEIARVQTRDGVAGDVRKGEIAAKSYVEVLRASGENGRRL